MKVHGVSFLVLAGALMATGLGSLSLPAFSDTVQTVNDNPKSEIPRAKEAKPKGDLPNFHQVHDFLYRGGEPSEKGLNQLKEMGVKTIIDLRAESEKKYAEGPQAKSLGLNYINLPMDSKAPTEEQKRTFIRTVEDAAANPKNGAVFVHCAHGSDRTGCMVGIWRVTHDHFDYDKAYEEMRKYYFSPKFTNLSGAVKDASSPKNQ